MTRQALRSGLPVTVGANMVSRMRSAGSRDVRADSRYSVCARNDISFSIGPVWRTSPSAIREIIFSSSSTTIANSSLSLRSLRKRTRSGTPWPPGGYRYVPLMGFIDTTSSARLMCRSGEAPTSVRSPVWIRNTQYAPCSDRTGRALGGWQRQVRQSVELDDVAAEHLDLLVTC